MARIQHNPRCAFFQEPPGLRDPNDCNCGAIPPLKPSSVTVERDTRVAPGVRIRWALPQADGLSTKYVEARMTDDGILEVYASDGRLVAEGRAMNVLYLRAEPVWSEKGKIGIVQNLMDEGKSAKDIVNVLAGRGLG